MPVTEAIQKAVKPLARAMEFAGPVLKPLAPVAKVVGTGAKVVGKVAGPVGVGMAGYEIYAEHGTGPVDETHFRMRRAESIPLMPVDAALKLVGATPIAETKIEEEKMRARQDARMLRQSVDLRKVKAVIQHKGIKEALIENGAAFDRDDRLDLTNKVNRDVVMKTLNEELKKIESEIGSKPLWLFASAATMNDYDARNAHRLTLSAAIGELQNHERAHRSSDRSIDGLPTPNRFTDAMARMDALPRLPGGEPYGEPLPPSPTSVPGGTRGRGLK
jgi:hypothetical protein